ncbi:MAG TPA: S8 family peptidase [Vicinamibacterales bacterium]|nr:S8 family peptidase [Vicinamibacterales bacterium]
MLSKHLAALLVSVLCAAPAFAGAAGDLKLDEPLRVRARSPRGTVRVIVQTAGGAAVERSARLVSRLGGRPGRRLSALRAVSAEVPESALAALAADGQVRKVSLDREVWPTMDRTGATIGAPAVREALGVDGTGVGVAIVDSGVTGWHDDLGFGPLAWFQDWTGTGQRITHFADFVGGYPDPYDDYGHGTHVAGVIAGNGESSGGARAGVAPGASLIALKVLDRNGRGYISDVIAAIDYAVAYRDYFNIRVLNLSVAAGVYESYDTDPLTLAAKRAVEKGIVVVTAAGNFGENAERQTQYGGVTSPGNAPWVLTVGASSHMGTAPRADDTVAGFSSRGPGRFDYAAKPDIVAPGVGLVSLSEPRSTLYRTRPQNRVWGLLQGGQAPYLSLSGTSMAAPVVAGTVALMLQANPTLTPNAVKAILQYTAETRSSYDHLTQGAGFLSTRGAVELASAMAGWTPEPIDSSAWNKHIIWGSHRVGGGALDAGANAWATNIVWGTVATPDGENIVWGTLCQSADCADTVWGTASGENIVWGTVGDGENIVWGTAGEHENIVWGTACGGNDCENIVWGTVDGENIVWGTVGGENIVWGTAHPGNVVWGTRARR